MLTPSIPPKAAENTYVANPRLRLIRGKYPVTFWLATNLLVLAIVMLIVAAVIL